MTYKTAEVVVTLSISQTVFQSPAYCTGKFGKLAMDNLIKCRLDEFYPYVLYTPKERARDVEL